MDGWDLYRLLISHGVKVKEGRQIHFHKPLPSVTAESLLPLFGRVGQSMIYCSVCLTKGGDALCDNNKLNA